MTSSCYVVVSGPIAGGKSTVSRFVADYAHMHVVSFGNLIRQIAAERGLPASRSIYQQLGEEVVRSLGPEGIVREAVRAAQLSAQDRIVFDGVRHLSVHAAIQKMASDVCTFYVDAPLRERYRRYCLAHPNPPVRWEEFLAADQHPMEQGSRELESVADLAISTLMSVEQVLEEVRKVLRAKEVLPP